MDGGPAARIARLSIISTAAGMILSADDVGHAPPPASIVERGEQGLHRFGLPQDANVMLVTTASVPSDPTRSSQQIGAGRVDQ